MVDVIDAYQHVGLPRFQSADDALRAMDAAGIDRALICCFETCPDLAEVHRALLLAPQRFLGFGIPLGHGREAVESGVRAQLAAGFSGLRLSAAHVRDQPWLLDVLGEAGAVALVCSSNGLEAEAAPLLRMLSDHPNALVLGGHFAGPTTSAVFENPAVAALFAHERFAVVASRQSLFEPGLLDSWMAELITRVGWLRLLWGSEAPVLYWREEGLRGASEWINSYISDPATLASFHGGNADRLLFARERPAVSPLELPFDPSDFLVERPAAMWPGGLGLPDELAGRLVHHWLTASACGTDGSTLGSHLAALVAESLPHHRSTT